MTAVSKTKITFTKRISDTPMSSGDWEASEDLLARMVARAIAFDLGWLKTEEIQNKEDE